MVFKCLCVCYYTRKLVSGPEYFQGGADDGLRVDRTAHEDISVSIQAFGAQIFSFRIFLKPNSDILLAQLRSGIKYEFVA
jgi:hypothetical protein